MMKTYPEFSSLEALNKYIEQYERRNYVQLWKRDCKTLNRMKAVCPKKISNCNMDLYYYSITYACTKGGKPFKTTGKGLRKTLTYKENCPMKIHVRISDDGQTLKVLNIDEKHNHYVEKEFFEALPKQRRKNSGTKKRPTKLINRLKGYKKSVRSYLDDKSEKQILSKDYKNSRNVNLNLKSDLDDVIKLLTQDNGFAHVATTEDGDLVGMYYQSSYMKKCFSAYPEVVVLDNTYKLHNNMPLYIILSINGNNEADVCCIFLITEDPASMILHMMNVFKTNNTEWKNIKTFMTDKDFGEKSVLHEEFPITVHQSCVLSDLKNSFAFDLFENATSFLDDDCFFESFYQKMEKLCNNFSNIESFFEDFIVLLNGAELKRKLNAEAMMPYDNKEGILFSPHVEAYRQVVTPYAFRLIKEQIEEIPKYKVYDTNESYIIQNKDDPAKQFIVSKSDKKTCTCEFNETNNLQCSHIFLVKLETGELFEEDVIPERFLKKKYFETYKGVEETRQTVEMLSTEQKLEIASERCKTIASIISQCNRHSFEKHIDQLDQLIESWSQGQETDITVHKETPSEEEDDLESVNDSNFKDEELNVDDCDSVIVEEVEMSDVDEQESNTAMDDTELPHFDVPAENRTRKLRGRPKRDD